VRRAELNQRIGELVEEFNDRVMRRYSKSRSQLFVYGEWKRATVNLDYHIEFDHHYYSVPYRLAHHEVEVRANALTVEVFERNHRVVSHVRSRQRGGFTTNPEHMPAAHRKHAEWTPERITAWAGKTGPQTRALAEAIFAERKHHEHVRGPDYYH
jgi:hypothetical protein